MKATSVLIFGLLLASLLIVSGCVNQLPVVARGLIAGPGYKAPDHCDIVLNRIRRAIIESGVRDAQDRYIRGFPFLRVNRFLAHVGRRFDQENNSPAFSEWINRLQTLELDGLRVEIANLPIAKRRRLARNIAAPGTSRSTIVGTARRCGDWSKRRYFSTTKGRQRLLRAARVADNYSDAAQILGAYPLTSIPVNQGWKRWKAKHLTSFVRPLSDQPLRGRLIEFVPSATARPLTTRQVRTLLRKARQSPLRIPEPRGKDLDRLLETFAPVWQLDVVGQYDRPGVPTWQPGSTSVQVDVNQSVTFTRVGHAILDNKIHLQLSYTIWFQKRPSIGPLDLLSGNLDGLVWRVTLDQDGRPLMYDSIHLCGCYHFLFPVDARFTRSQAERNPALKEVPAIITGLRPPRHGQRIVLRLASGSHYLLAAAAISKSRTHVPQRQYRFVGEARLRSLPFGNGQRRSLYGSDGIIAGTERLERFILWPTGVVSPGAMRQWGHHAIAFADRRHFDDPNLFDKIFAR